VIDTLVARVSPRISAGISFLESRKENILGMNITVLSPGSFKIHMERPLPIRADNTSRAISGYNPATMEWSNDGVTYSGGMPIIPDGGGAIYVRGIGDSKYGGNDPVYGDYKKYVPSEAQVTFEPKAGFTGNIDGGEGEESEIGGVGDATGIAAVEQIADGGDPIAVEPDTTVAGEIEEAELYETDDANERDFFEQNADKKTPITSIKINASAVTAAVRGGTYNFSVALNEGALDDDVIWLVSNPLLANVDNSGAVTILDRTGTVALTAIDPSSGLSHSIVLRIV